MVPLCRTGTHTFGFNGPRISRASLRCCASSGARKSRPFLRLGLLLHVGPQHGIHPALIAVALTLEIIEHVFVDTNGDRLLLRTGITRTASDQSISMGAASGSPATALAMSSSVRASTRAQSVLPFLGESLETIVIFSSLVASRAPGRDDPAERAPDRAGDCDFPLFDVTEDLIPDFAMTIRSADKGVGRREFRARPRSRSCGCAGCFRAFSDPIRIRERLRTAVVRLPP